MLSARKFLSPSSDMHLIY